MKANDILKLLDAGYTREEILDLEAAPEEAPETPEGTPEETPEDNKEQDPVLSTLMATLEELKTSNATMAKQLKELQKSNVKKAEQPQPATMTAEDVIRNFIHGSASKSSSSEH